MSRSTRPAKSSGVILIVSLLIITGAFVISLSIASLVMVAINISRTQGDSVRAYYEADSGIERALAFDRQELIDRRNCGPGGKAYLCCADQVDSCLFFDQIVPGHEGDGIVSGCFDCKIVQPQYLDINKKQSYFLIYRGTSDNDSQLKLESTGNSNGVKRSIKLIISRTAGCIPQCSEKDSEGNIIVTYECGYNGCNGFCGSCDDETQDCLDHQCVAK